MALVSKTYLIALWVISCFAVSTFASASASAQNQLVLHSVSVEAQGHVQLHWSLNSSVQNGYFQIHRLQQGIYLPVALVGLDQSSYLDQSVDASTQSFTYYLSAHHPDGASFAESLAHQTLWLHTATPNICQKQINLQWNKYQVFTTWNTPAPVASPFDHAQILFSRDSEAFSFLDKFPQNQEQYLYSLSTSGDYCFVIEAFNEQTGRNARSNIVCRNVQLPDPPAFAHIRWASASEWTPTLEIGLYVDNTIPDPAYVLSRRPTMAAESSVLDTIFSPQSDVLFVDISSEATSAPWYYQVEVLDYCRAPRLRSNSVRSIFLHARQSIPSEVLLEWNAYEGWDSGVGSYQVYRQETPQQAWQLLATLPPSQTHYADDISPGGEPLRQVLYRIQAHEATVNEFGLQDAAWSNPAILEPEIKIFIPNAFRPESPEAQNRIFKPHFPYYTPSAYTMQIFNRWGQVIFESRDVQQGWDGRHNGRDLSVGVYAYRIVYQDAQGKMQEHKGALMLLR